MHPRVGALDVAPIVYLDPTRPRRRVRRGARARRPARRAARLPVFLYGILADGRTRAELRRGGPASLAARIARGELTPDFGPRGFTRPPARCSSAPGRRWSRSTSSSRRRRALDDAQARSPRGSARAAPDGLAGVRAIGLWLDHRGRRPGLDERRGPPRDAAGDGRRGGRAGTRPSPQAELVGLAPRAAFEAFPGRDRGPSTSAILEDLLATSQTKLHTSMAQTKRKRRTQAPRHRRRHDRDARTHGPPAERRGAQEAGARGRRESGG